MAIIIPEPLDVDAKSEWNVNIRIAPEGVPIDFSAYNEIVATWRVKEYDQVSVMIIESPRDQNAEGIIKLRTPAEDTARMKSDGVWDIFGDTQLIIKGYTRWNGAVK